MKISTKIISLAALALLVLAPASRAADNDGPPPPPAEERPRMKPMREHRMKQLEEKLHLTAEQKTQIKAIWDRSAEQGRAMQKENAAAREERREKMGAIMKATHDQVRGVLTPEQQTIFDALPVEGPRGGHGGPGGPGGPRGDGPPPPPPPAPDEKAS